MQVSHANGCLLYLRRLGCTDDFEAFLNELNERFKEFSVSNEKNLIWSLLSHIGVERGGQDDSGSIIWADFFEHADKKNWIDNDSITQIVGHTQLISHPGRIDNRLYCLDCRESFYVDNKGVIRSWSTDEDIMTKYNILEKLIMLGAIVGDTVESIYEFENTKGYNSRLFNRCSGYTDDSITSMAMAYWLLKDSEHRYETLEVAMVTFAKNCPYPNGRYGEMSLCQFCVRQVEFLGGIMN